MLTLQIITLAVSCLTLFINAYLEQREVLTQKQFCVIWEEFCKKQGQHLGVNLKLTDCVNLYYWV